MTAKERLKRKLAKLPLAKRKQYIQRLKAKRREKQQQEGVDSPHVVTALQTLFGDSLGKVTSKRDAKALTKGIGMLQLWKGLQAVATLAEETRKHVREMHRAGVLRKPKASTLVDAGIEVRTINPVKLNKFVKKVPGLWAKWGCEDARCSQCPYHRSKGIEAQNRKCAEDSVKEAMKHNTRVDLAKRLPHNKETLEKLPRTKLVQFLGMLGINPFSLKDSSKVGIVKYLTPARQKKLKVTDDMKRKVTIPESLE